jgi:hypothetical protein
LFEDWEEGGGAFGETRCGGLGDWRGWEGMVEGWVRGVFFGVNLGVRIFSVVDSLNIDVFGYVSHRKLIPFRLHSKPRFSKSESIPRLLQVDRSPPP